MKAELHERAVMWLTRAHLRAPLCERIKRLLAEALVRSDQPETALEVMSLIPLPFPLLRARSLRMLGRLRDAADVLDTAIASSARSAEAVGIDERDADKGVLSADDSFDALLTESLIVSELRGDSGDICRFSKLITDSTPGAMLQAAKHELARGAFRHAIRRAVSLRGDQIHGAASLAIITAAAGMMQRNRLATRALRKLRKRFGSSNLPVMHECWRRAMLGEIIRDQRNPRRACADPASSVLRPLLKQTVRTLERRLHRHTAADATHDVEMIQQHYALCRDALKLRSKATA